MLEPITVARAAWPSSASCAPGSPSRRLLDLHVEVFWLVAGSLFLLGGISEVAPFGIDVKLIPLVCIVAGIVLVARALRRGPPLTASRRDLPGT